MCTQLCVCFYCAPFPSTHSLWLFPLSMVTVYSVLFSFPVSYLCVYGFRGWELETVSITGKTDHGPRITYHGWVGKTGYFERFMDMNSICHIYQE